MCKIVCKLIVTTVNYTTKILQIYALWVVADHINFSGPLTHYRTYSNGNNTSKIHNKGIL